MLPPPPRLLLLQSTWLTFMSFSPCQIGWCKTLFSYRIMITDGGRTDRHTHWHRFLHSFIAGKSVREIDNWEQFQPHMSHYTCSKSLWITLQPRILYNGTYNYNVQLHQLTFQHPKNHCCSLVTIMRIRSNKIFISRPFNYRSILCQSA